MKTFSFLITLILLTSCQSNEQINKEDVPSVTPSELIGSWTTTNLNPDNISLKGFELKEDYTATIHVLDSRNRTNIYKGKWVLTKELKVNEMLNLKTFLSLEFQESKNKRKTFLFKEDREDGDLILSIRGVDYKHI
ncbi:hypothetical protein [Zhouia amylolytica]|uniref:Lipocalin-like domain-containing protein n=1 Tax=Zhouia amylolytica AD3 TaxID=1286632 RepID=W2UIX8_9FLAO|nr:hypothetical protein [Zhouia amylolytica]ETN93973.1 hypothetical protein P278_31050 [Zhouia amylolytica AD3]